MGTDTQRGELVEPIDLVEQVEQVEQLEQLEQVEQVVRAVWSELLGIENAPADADFFALGGDSLLLVRFAGRLRTELDRHVAPHELLARPTPAGMTAVMLAADALQPGDGESGLGVGVAMGDAGARLEAAAEVGAQAEVESEANAQLAVASVAGARLAVANTVGAQAAVASGIGAQPPMASAVGVQPAVATMESSRLAVVTEAGARRGEAGSEAEPARGRTLMTADAWPGAIVGGTELGQGGVLVEAGAPQAETAAGAWMFAVRLGAGVGRDVVAEGLTWVARRHRRLRTFSGADGGVCVAEARFVECPVEVVGGGDVAVERLVGGVIGRGVAPLVRAVVAGSALFVAIDRAVFGVADVPAFVADLEVVCALVVEGAYAELAQEQPDFVGDPELRSVELAWVRAV